MRRGAMGEYVAGTGGGEACRAFVPAPLPPVPALAIGAALQEKMDQAHIALGRLDSLTTLLPAPSVFLYGYVRKEAVLSSQIEGTQSSLSDLLLYEADAAPGVPVEDVREVSSYVVALDHGMRLMKDGLPLCLRLLREVHQILLAHGRGADKAPGEFRRVQNWVGGVRPSRAVFVPPPPNRLQAALGDFERFLNDEPHRHPPLIKAALAHVQFETIHPFLDGNGRLGRMLIPMIFSQEGILGEPLLYLSLFFKTHRDDYYDLLQRVRLDGDWEAWIEFFADAVAATSAQAVATAQSLTALGQDDRRRIRDLGRVAGSALQVLDALSERPVRTVTDITHRTGLSYNTVAKILGILEQDLGMAREVTGRRRNRVFAYPAYLAILNREFEDQ